MTIDQSVILKQAQNSDLSGLVQLLHAAGLPVEDLPGDLTHFIVAKQDNQIIGSVGLEILGSYALLRSLAVDATWQGKGVGAALYQAVVRMAREKSIEYLYLITTTADQYFKKLGFGKIDRANVPEVIRQTSQFSGICPSSAIVMIKKV